MIFTYQIDEQLSLALPQPFMSQELFEITDKNRERLIPNLPWVNNVREASDTLSFINRALQNYSDGKDLQLVIFWRGRIVGTVGFVSINPKHRQAEIGYWLDKEHSGQGIVTKCVREVIKHGFQVLNLHRIQIRCATTNLPSQKVALRVGMREEGILKGDHWNGQEFQDTVVYAIVQSEFVGK
jgi:ribosomal-protein-serine acetyltransferase